GAPSALLKLMPTAAECCSHDSKMECSNRSQSGTTCEPSTATPGADTSMLSAEDSPAKTSAQLEKAQGSTASDPDYGLRCQGLFARYDRDSRLWRTPQCSLLAGLDVYSETWPRWGSMRDGECWEQPTAAPRTSATESGLLPTPCATDARPITGG